MRLCPSSRQHGRTSQTAAPKRSRLPETGDACDRSPEVHCFLQQLSRPNDGFALTDLFRAAQRKGFKRQALDVVHVPYPNEIRNPFSAAECGDGGASQGALNWIEERLFKTSTPPEEVAGIVVEAVQGEGGYVPHRKNFSKDCGVFVTSKASC